MKTNDSGVVQVVYNVVHGLYNTIPQKNSSVQLDAVEIRLSRQDDFLGHENV